LPPIAFPVNQKLIGFSGKTESSRRGIGFELSKRMLALRFGRYDP
jgi:hypothetical protein